jgi:hypothetical protein
LLFLRIKKSTDVRPVITEKCFYGVTPRKHLFGNPAKLGYFRVTRTQFGLIFGVLQRSWRNVTTCIFFAKAKKPRPYFVPPFFPRLFINR